MKFDVCFIDTVAPRYYDLSSLEAGVLGGTEASVVRLAEGLGSLGLEVAVIQKTSFDFEPIAGDKCLFLPWSYIDQVKPVTVVHLRSVANLSLFTNSRQFVWCHDLPDERVKQWLPVLKEYNTKLIAVSEWQKRRFHEIESQLPIVPLYSPVDELCYQHPRMKHHPDKLVWLASPHKGLDQALDTFKKLRSDIPSMSLTVMCPGYIEAKVRQQPGVNLIGVTPRPILRSIVAQSLCLFYPTQFEETFGLIAAEANALGTPVATYKVAALAESVSPFNGWCRDDQELIQTIKDWRTSRHEVSGQQRFRLTRVLPQWINTLDGR